MTNHIPDALRTLAQMQERLWRQDRKERLQGTTEEVRTVAIALVAEILELSDELGWKSWKPAPDVDRQRVLQEYADVMAFFGTLTAMVIWRCGIYPEELVEEYLRKAEVNAERFQRRDEEEELNKEQYAWLKDPLPSTLQKMVEIPYPPSVAEEEDRGPERWIPNEEKKE